MVNQVYLTVFQDGNALSHPVILANNDYPASIVEEFQHQVLYLGHALYFDKSAIRVHKPLLVKMQIEQITPQILQYLTRGDTVEKVKITWFQYNERTRKEEEYFSHLFENVRFECVRLILPDSKSVEFEKHNHQMEVAFRYKRVTWTYLDGNLIYTDEWNNGYEEEAGGEAEEENSESQQEAEEEVSEDQTATDAEIRLTEGIWVAGEKGFKFNESCKIRVKGTFINPACTKKVSVETFAAFDGDEQNLCQSVDVFLNSDGEGDATVKLYYHDRYYDALLDNPAAVCQYKFTARHPKGENELVSELLDMPYIEKINVDFVEIMDLHFHHNCALPCLDNEGKLIDALVAVFKYASQQPDSQLIVHGHADRSGEPDYNFRISRRRARLLKHSLIITRRYGRVLLLQMDQIKELRRKITSKLLRYSQ